MNKRKILVIDDEVNFIKILKLNLEDTGNYDVTVLTNAKDLISVLYQLKPDLILLDLLMPGIGGIEACDMLNADPMGQKIPIIILSALEKSADKLKAYKKGVVDYLVKTAQPEEIIASIEKAIQFKNG